MHQNMWVYYTQNDFKQRKRKKRLTKHKIEINKMKPNYNQISIPFLHLSEYGCV